MPKLIKLPEPQILFRHGQLVEDPRDGLTLFGPLDAAAYGIRAGAIGTSRGLSYFRKWVESISRFIAPSKPSLARPPYPGFEAAYRAKWHPSPVIEVIVDEKEIDALLYQEDVHQRVYGTVDYFAKRIQQAASDDEEKTNVWFVILPDRIRTYCRPKSRVEADLRIKSTAVISKEYAKKLLAQPSMFQADNDSAVPYQFEPQFHHQLKGRLLGQNIPTQIILESTIKPLDECNELEKKSLGLMGSQIAWTLSTATYYKAFGRPWKIGGLRPGVCYLGIVFKQETKVPGSSNACCAAQMFLDSGDGVVFKGAVGPWYNPKQGDYHLQPEAASQLIALAIDTYKKKFQDEAPKELFIHGKVRFTEEEFQGFKTGAPAGTNVVGVQIKVRDRLKLFALSDYPVLRGTAFIQDSKSAYLWTNGLIPRMKTYPGREVPNPLEVRISAGDANIETVIADVLALTKLNYNSCIFGDGKPVTLRFADAIGEILTSGPLPPTPPLAFRYYI
jgi:hypothetical protein